MLARRHQNSDLRLNSFRASRLTQPTGYAGGHEPMSRDLAQDSLFEIAFRHKRTIGLSTLICLCLGVVFLLVVTPSYIASSRLLVQRQGPRIIGTAAAVTRSDDDGAFLFTQREIVRSAPVLSIALNNLGALRSFEGERNRFESLRKQLNVEVGKKDELISVSFQSPYPEEAQKIVAAVVDGYIEFQSRQKRSTAGDVQTILKDEKARRESELDQRVKALQEFRKANGLLSTDADKAQIMLERLKSLSDAVNAARVETLNAKAAYDDCTRTILADPQKAARVLELRNSSSFSVLTAADEQLIRQELFQYEARLEDAKRQYGENHPSYKLLLGRAEQLQVTYAAAVMRRYDQAAVKEADLAKLLEKQQQEAIGEQNKAAQYARLQSEVDRVQKQLDELDGRMKEVSFAEDSGVPGISVLEPARADEKPAFPSTGKTLALAMMIGLIGGLGFAFFRDRYDYPLQSARQIRDVLGAQVIGLVPRMTARGRILETDPSSDVAEACRALYNLIADHMPPEESKTILVTSPSRGDGKSTLAANLAVAMAQQGKRVLLVDADFRSPSLHRIFNLRGRDGLSNLLAGQEIAGGIVHESGVSALDVVPCGTFLGNPPEMLGGERFGAVLEYITGIYDHVILDAPPTVPVDDARIIARSCDMTLLVLRAGRANRRLAELARDGLCAVGARIMGVVVNDVDPHSYAKYDGVYEDGPVAGATPTRQASAPAEEVAGDFDVQLRTMLARRPAAAATPHFNTSGGADKSAGRTQAQAVHHGSIDADLDDDQTDRDSSDRR